ncbi:hypothetical protein L7F22_038854 [Adiantum nelumboides]|nr:hypothetical protein [Adiantum nelumboides]
MTNASLPPAKESYEILAAGYSGAVVPLHFQPPSTLEIVKHGQLNNQTGDSPSWITFTKGKFPPPFNSNTLAYVTSESENNGTAYVLQKEQGNPLIPSSSPWKVIGNKKGYSTAGGGPVASCVQGQCLYVANYNSGSAAVIQLNKDGIPIEQNNDQPASVFQYKVNQTGPVTTRQDHSYAHDAVASPEGKWVYICDLGADQIHHIKATQSSDCSKSIDQQNQSTQLGSGTGPRHLAFYQDKITNKQYAYLTSELACTLTAFEHNPDSGALNIIGKPVLSVPEGTPLGGNQTAGPQRTTAELAISPDGKFIYVSDRGDEVEDHITIYKRDQKDGSIEFQKWVKSGGKMPRHFSLSQDGHFFAIAHQTTGNVIIFKRDPQSGDLIKTGAEVKNLDQVAFAGFVPK